MIAGTGPLLAPPQPPAASQAPGVRQDGAFTHAYAAPAADGQAQEGGHQGPWSPWQPL